MERELKAADRVLNSKTSSLNKEMVKQYNISLKRIRGELAQAESRYGLEYSEMQKYNRLQKLEKEIRSEVVKLTGKNSRALTAGLKEQYKEGYYRASFAIEKNANLMLGFGSLNPDVVKAAVDNPLMDLAKTRLRANTIATINQGIIQGLIRGEGYRNITKRLKNNMEESVNNLRRIVNTETHRVQMTARNDSFGEAVEKGVKMKKRWVAAVDERVRDSHQDLDGEEVEYNQPFSNDIMFPGESGGEPEEVINCRCSYIGVIAGYEPEVRRIRGEGVKPYQTYKEWEKNKL